MFFSFKISEDTPKFIFTLCNKAKIFRFKFVALNFKYFIEIMEDILAMVDNHASSTKPDQV